MMQEDAGEVGEDVGMLAGMLATVGGDFDCIDSVFGRRSPGISNSVLNAVSHKNKVCF